MAIGTYSELRSAVAGWLNREDLTSRIFEFVSLAHSDINRKLRTQEMVTLLSATAAAATVDMPDDCEEVLYISLGDDGTTGDLDLVSLPELKKRYDLLPEAGPPSCYALAGQRIYFARWAESVAYALAYYASVPALVGDDDTNWLLTKHPDVYLYGALAHSAPFLMEDERVPLWTGAYQNALESLNGRNTRQQFAGQPMARRGRL